MMYSERGKDIGNLDSVISRSVRILVNGRRYGIGIPLSRIVPFGDLAILAGLQYPFDGCVMDYAYEGYPDGGGSLPYDGNILVRDGMTIDIRRA